jgi:DHA1 family inner membrane transport protein
VITMAAEAAPLALSLNGSALYLGVALGSVVGGEVLTYGTPADLGVVAALFPLLALGVVGLARPAASLASARLG